MKPNQPDKTPDRFLGDYLYSDVPAQLLVAGDLSAALLSRPVDGVSLHRFNTLAEAERHVSQHATIQLSQDAGPSTLVLQLNACEPHLEQRLGRAIRAFPHRVLVHCTHSADKATDDTFINDDVFFAFGFRKLQLATDKVAGEPESTRWFEFRLSQYKAAPDWLNARFWANPERFESDEDPDIYCDDDEE